MKVADVLNSRTLKDIMPLITQMHARAHTCNTGQMQSLSHRAASAVLGKNEQWLCPSDSYRSEVGQGII